MQNALEHGSDLHLFGIVSDAGVHGLLEHLYRVPGALQAARAGSRLPARLHRWTRHVAELRAWVHPAGRGEDEGDRRRPGGDGRAAATTPWTATTAGRACRRRIDAIAFGKGPKFKSAEEAIASYYAHPTESNMSGDEFITPSIITDDGATPRAMVRGDDSVLFYNYRGDRPREITKAFVLSEFPVIDPAAGTVFGFDRGPEAQAALHDTDGLRDGPARQRRVSQAAEDEQHPWRVRLGAGAANSTAVPRRRSFRTSRSSSTTTAKQPFPGEDRHMVPSPQVSTYDQMPEMSAYGDVRRGGQAGQLRARTT